LKLVIFTFFGAAAGSKGILTDFGVEETQNKVITGRVNTLVSLSFMRALRS